MHSGSVRTGIFLCGLLSAAVPAMSAPMEALPTPLLRKADPWVIRKLESGGSEEFLVVLREKADVSAATRLRDKRDKGQFVFDNLRAVAARTQGPLLAWLSARGIEHRAFWIANMVLVKGDASVARELAAREEVARLAANPLVRFPDPQPASPPENPGTVRKAAAAVEWGVAKIRAPELWAAGFTGQGIVVAGADTGVEWTHSALKAKYRGWNGVSANHDYNWHDAIHASNIVCDANTQEPCDDDGHGTHTMGTMVGDGGAGNQIGVAPGARWIGCRNMDRGAGTPATYTECFQWFVAPTDLGGTNPDVSKAPHVINNSWACPFSEGCTDPNVLRAVVENVRAAGIVVVVAAGNSGPSCASISDPPGIYDAALTVGATDIADNIAGFSSRGPVTADGSNRLKPDVSAPGVNVRSSVPGDGYNTYSGTSMAGPHVAGTVALLLSAHPSLAGQPAVLESRIENAAVPRTSATTCADVPGSSVPNNTYGSGRLDAKAAFDAENTAPAATLDIDASITETRYDALTDGVLALRYLFGLTGSPLTSGALGTTATRTDPVAIKAYLDSIRGALDIDGDGATDALTDGLLIVRYLFGLRGAALIRDVIGPAATRKTAADIEVYLQSLLP